MKLKKLFVLALAMLPVSMWAQGLKIERLAGDYVNIRVSANEQSKYLLLPVEEKMPESQISIIANNDLVRNINVKLAVNRVDYFVPILLDEFRGKNVEFLTHMSIDHSNRGGVGSEVRISEIRLTNDFDMTNKEKYRPTYHHTPTYGWMNDPNGMFYLDGVWHLFYQYNPYGSMWGNMNWAHATSTDLIHWEQQGVALAPDANGTIFSGSCVVDKDGTAGFGKNAVIAMYTSCIQTPHGHDLQTQSLAYSLDGGKTFKKYDNNPVLTADIADFRDPNPFWNEAVGKWNLIMASGQEMRLYSSPNLKDWSEESRFGQGLGCHKGVWECPDLMKLKVKGTNEEKWVLICNINPGGPFGGSATQYFIGDFDGHKFTVDDASRYSDGKALWQDYGMDHYATVSFYNAPDGRHPMMAWMSNWEYANSIPTLQYRSANSIARDPFLYKGNDGQLYLGSQPSPEYDNAGLDKVVKLKGSKTITLSNAQGEEAVIVYDEKAMTLSFDRSKSGEVGFSKNFDVKTVAPLHKKLTSLRIFVDNSSVEVFGNDGEAVLTNLVYPKSPLTDMKVK
ncbi:MAG: DUF4980 domain-containing protein [Bacteroidaceae bacterium]|nr:DUF4980 domain-containing protein [Bacteroidaceae bacterium]